MPEVFVSKEAQFKDGDRRIVQTQKGDIGVFRHAGEFFAYSNNCPHSGGPACEGVMMPRVLDVIAEDKTYRGQAFSETEMHFVCPWHGYEYDLKTGQCIGDKRLKLRAYKVVRRGGDVFVEA